MNLTVKRLSGKDINDFIALISIFEDVFEMKDFHMPDVSHLQQVLNRDDFHVFVALDGETVIAGLTAYTLQQYYSTKPLVYIYDLAVNRNYQRKGIGKMLITAINDYCRAAGAEEVFVQADEADDYAIDFYHSTGAVPEKVVHFSYPLNK